LAATIQFLRKGVATAMVDAQISNRVRIG